MKVLDLFSGVGGFSFGLEKAGMETVAFCEIDLFCRRVLKKHWPHVPIFKDVNTLNAETLRKRGIKSVDVIAGGFPCQPYSVAGKKAGTKDNRDLWPQMRRIIAELQPAWVIGENVAHFTRMAFTRSKLDMENMGYTVQPLIIPACAIGTLHKRERVWILAHRGGHGSQGRGAKPIPWQSPFSWLENVRGFEDLQRRSALHTPMLCRTDDGIPNWVDRLRAIGNAVPPAIPEIIGRGIMRLSGYSDDLSLNKSRGLL